MTKAHYSNAVSWVLRLRHKEFTWNYSNCVCAEGNLGGPTTQKDGKGKNHRVYSIQRLLWVIYMQMHKELRTWQNHDKFSFPSAHYSDKVFFFVELLTDWCGGVCYCCSGIPHLLVAEQKTTDVKMQFSLESLVPLWNEKLIKTKSSAGTFEVCLPENWPVDSYRPFRFISGDMGDDEIHSHCHWNLHHVTNGH